MKLADLQEETIWRGIIDGESYDAILINETLRIAPSGGRGGIIKQSLRKGAAAITANPGLAALGAGLSLVGATMFGAMAADLSEYPAPFIKDGVFDAVLVVGTGGSDPDI